MSEGSAPAGKDKAKYGVKRPKVPAFARYEGTSAWRKYKVRVRAYARFKAAQAAEHPAA